MDPYTIKIGGVVADPYRIAISYGLDPAIGEAAKKLLRCGRKHKDIKTDVQEAIKTLTRWLVIQDDIEREAMIESMRYAPSVERVSTEFPIDKVKEAIAKGSSDERAGLVPADDAYIVHSQPTYAGLTQEQIAERNKQCASNAAPVGFAWEEAARRFQYPNPDYVDAKDDTAHIDLSKLSSDELTAAGFPEDGIVREVLRQQSNSRIGPCTMEPPPSVSIVSGFAGNHAPAPGSKTNMEKILDERAGETNWP